MDFDTQLKQALKQGHDNGLNEDQLNQLSQKMIADYQSQRKSTVQQTTQPDDEGLVKGLIRSMAKPFIQPVLTATQVLNEGISGGTSLASDALLGLGEATGSDTLKSAGRYSAGLADNMDKTLEKYRTEGYDTGYFGKVKPFGGNGTSQLNTALESAGVGAQLVSNAVGGAGFWAPTLKTLGLQVGGNALEKTGTTDKTGGQIAQESAIEGAVTTAAMGLLHGGGTAAGYIGRKFMKSDAAQALGKWVAESVDNMYQKLPEKFNETLTGTYKGAKAVYSAMKDEFNTKYKNEVDKYAASVQKPVMEDEAFHAVQSEHIAGLEQDYKAKSNLINNSLKNSSPINMPSVEDAVGRAEEKMKYIDTLFGKTGKERENFINSQSLFSKDELAAIFDSSEKTGQTPAMPQLKLLLNDLRSVLSDTKTGQFTGAKPEAADIIGNLKIPSYAAKAESKLEETLINQFQHHIFDDIGKGLKESSPEQFALWQKGQNLFKELRSTKDADFSQQFKVANNPTKYIDENIIDSKIPLVESSAVLGKIKNPVAKEKLSQMILNRVVERAQAIGKKVSSDPAEQGKAAADFIDSFLQKEGIDNAVLQKHQSDLYSLESVYRQDFDSVLNSAKELYNGAKSSAEDLNKAKLDIAKTEKISGLVKEQRWSEVSKELMNSSKEELDVLLKGVNEEGKQAIADEVVKNTIGKNVNVFASDADKYNFEGIYKSLNSLGKGEKGEFVTKVFPESKQKDVKELIGLLENVKDLSSVDNKAALPILHSMAAVFNASLARFYGAAYQSIEALQSLSKIAPGKNLEKDIFNMLKTKGKLDEPTLVRIYQDAFKPAATMVAKQASGDFVESFDEITPEEASKLGLPKTFVGKSTSRLEKEKKSETPPEWFIKVLNERKIDKDPKAVWDNYRKN